MQLKFKESKDSVGTVLVYNPNMTKIAHVNSKNRKVSICGNSVSKHLERTNGLEKTKEIILAHYDNWVYENSPFSKLNNEDLNKLQNSFIAINLLSASLDNIVQDVIKISKSIDFDIDSISELSDILESVNKSSVNVLGQDLAIDAFDMSDDITSNVISKSNEIRIKALNLIK